MGMTKQAGSSVEPILDSFQNMGKFGWIWSDHEKEQPVTGRMS